MGSLSRSSNMRSLTTILGLAVLSVATLGSKPPPTTSAPNMDKIITEVEIDTKIMYRYAQTVVTSTMKNVDNTTQEVVFNMTLPEMAFISNFTMTTGGKEHVADVMGREEAKLKYNDAKNKDMSAGVVSGRNRNFEISANVRPQEKIVFHLTYDERLERREGSYRYKIYLSSLPQLTKMKASVSIKESLSITNITITQPNTPDENWEPAADTRDISFDWEPEEDDYASLMKQGLGVQYSVEERKNEVQVMCGHFIHWFTPDKIKRNKFLVFVLDVSGSMSWSAGRSGSRIKQLKNAMKQILTKMMSRQDYFSIITFSNDVNKWTGTYSQLERSGIFRGKDKNKARRYVNDLEADGGTNINLALLEGIKLAEQSNSSLLAMKNLAPMVVFLTDGDATVGEQDTGTILKNVHDRNTKKIPILTLGFGSESDYTLLQRISAQTDSLSRMIFDGVDAEHQLENFFHEIERPTLSNVKFDYIGNVKQDSLSKVYQGQMFSGGEHVTVGETLEEEGELTVKVSADSLDGPVATKTILQEENYSRDQSHCEYMKRFFAYVTIKQDIERGRKRLNDILLEKAKNMSLANNFVTDLTSLVVVIESDLRSDDSDTYTSSGSGDDTGMATPIDGLDIASVISPENNTAAMGACSITLYSEEYWDGESVTFSEAVPDLSVWDWEEKLASVQVEGDCQWLIFTEKANQGKSEVFTSSQRYLEEGDVGEVFLNSFSLAIR